MKSFFALLVFVFFFIGITLSVTAQVIGVPLGPLPQGTALPLAPDAYAPIWTAPWPPLPELPTPGPTPVPLGFYTIEVYWQTMLYTCPDYACYWFGHSIKVGAVINVQSIGGLPGWLWIKSGEFTGQFIHDDGSFQRL